MNRFATTKRTPGGTIKVPMAAFCMLEPKSSEFRRLSRELMTVQVIPDKTRPGVSTLNVKDTRK